MKSWTEIQSTVSLRGTLSSLPEQGIVVVLDSTSGCIEVGSGFTITLDGTPMTVYSRGGSHRQPHIDDSGGCDEPRFTAPGPFDPARPGELRLQEGDHTATARFAGFGAPRTLVPPDAGPVRAGDPIVLSSSVETDTFSAQVHIDFVPQELPDGGAGGPALEAVASGTGASLTATVPSGAVPGWYREQVNLTDVLHFQSLECSGLAGCAMGTEDARTAALYILLPDGGGG